MTEEQARALIGRQWGEEVAAQDWSGWYPVLGEDGRIEEVYSAEGTIADAAKRGWAYDWEAGLYRINGPLAGIVVALLARDDGANGGSEEDASDIAREWLDAGYDDMDVRRWLDAGVCFADHARALQAAGLGPDDIPEGMGWLSDEDIANILAEDEEAEEEEPR
jgi:hypothetical protein